MSPIVTGGQEDTTSPYSMSGDTNGKPQLPRQHPDPQRSRQLPTSDVNPTAAPGVTSGVVYAVVTKKKPGISDLDVAENTLYHTYDGHSEGNRVT